MTILERIELELKQKLRRERYEHSIKVALLAQELAQAHHINSQKAFLAGLFHDFARDLPERELLQTAREENLVADTVESAVPILLHGKVGAKLLEKEMQVKNHDILKAVAVHTLGAPGMTKLQKIIYLADMLEPGRCFSGMDRLRQAALEDLDKALLLAFDHVLQYNINKKRLIHPQTVRARNYLLSDNQS